MPAASPSLARSTNKRVRSSVFRALSLSGTGILPGSGWEYCSSCPAVNEKSNRSFFWELESTDMEMRQLEYFIAVAEEANFTRAAQRVHISQSGVSAQVRQLEHELGATLIDRSGRTAALTAAGAAALPHARAALASASAVRQAVDAVNGLIRGRVVVGMVTACTVAPLFDALATFHQAHPGVEITPVSYTHLRAHETRHDLVCRLLLEKKKKT